MSGMRTSTGFLRTYETELLISTVEIKKPSPGFFINYKKPFTILLIINGSLRIVELPHENFLIFLTCFLISE